MGDTTYNGWTNYETWNLALWIDNEEGSYDYWREQAREVYREARADQTFSRVERAALDLAARLKDEIEENSPAGVTGFYADVLNAALGEVNYYEICEHWIEDIKDDEPDEDDDTEEASDGR